MASRGMHSRHHSQTQDLGYSPDRRRRYSPSPDRRDRDRRDRDRRDDRKDREDRDRRDRDRRDARKDDRKRDYDRKDNNKRSRDEREDREEQAPKRSRKEEEPSPPKQEEEAMQIEEELPPAPKQQPKDLEALLQSSKAAEAGNKPTFMSKEDRKALAIKKRAEEVAAQRALQEQERLSRQQFFQQATTPVPPPSSSSRRDEKREDPRDDKRAERRKDDERREKERDDKMDVDKAQEEQSAREKQREETKKAYLGIKEQKKRFIKPSEKYKFVFEWDKSEDTSQDLNPLYNEKYETIPQFGRGYFGGIDKREQLKKYQQMVKESKKELAEDKLALVERQSKKYDSQLLALDKSESAGLHWTDKKLNQMTARDWRIFKEDFKITTKGGLLPNPVRAWDESGLPQWLLDGIKEVGYVKPTPVQMQAIPIGLSGRDILGVAETGSGKTCAFVLPMLVHISKLPPMTRDVEVDGPYAVILAPTRELASQIADETEKFAKFNGYRCVLLVGGASIEEQALKLRQGCEIVVATPGRLNDCIENHYVVLNQCNYVVLDEADRMVDMGFEPQVISVLESMPSESLKSELEEEAAQQEKDHRNKFRTTLMFSATMPIEVERLSRRYLRRPGIIYIGDTGKAVSTIQQEVFWVHGETDKKRRLEALLRDGPPPPIIIFVNQRKTCDMVAKMIGKLGYKCTTLQGGRSQDQRDWALNEFREGRSDILVATDVAGRGLDVKGVTHVINFDMPKSIDQYTHRIGRTGRAGSSGLASSFVHTEDVEILWHLKKALQDAGANIPAELRDHPEAQVKPGTVVQKSRRETVIYTNS